MTIAQQAVVLFIFIFLKQHLLVWAYYIIDRNIDYQALLVGSIVTASIWPIIYYALRFIRRKFNIGGINQKMLSRALPTSSKITLHKTHDGYEIRDNEKNMKMSLSFDDYSKILKDRKKHQLNKIVKTKNLNILVKMTEI